MEFLLIRNGQEIGDRFTFFLESTYGVSVRELDTLDDALEFFGENTAEYDIGLVVIDRIEDETLTREFVENLSDVPVVLCLNESDMGRVEDWKGTFRTASRANLMDDVIRIVDDLAESGMIDLPKSEEGQVRIRTRLLLSVAPLQGDVYIRLNSKKFVKLFRAGDVFDADDLEKYTEKKGVEYLYIQKEQCVEFTKKLITDLQKKLIKEPPLTFEETVEVTESVHEAVVQLLKVVGFTEDLQEAVKNQVALTVKSVGEDPVMTRVLLKFDQMGESVYITRHSIILAYLASALAAQMEWGSESTFSKLTLAAYLHDITLSNHKLAMIQTLKELNDRKNEFSAEEIKAYKEHPIKASELAEKMTKIPPDVGTIIRQHHERPDGSGFPGSLEHNRISPLSSIFIVAHELTTYFIRERQDFNIEAFLQGIRGTYKSNHFRKILACLESLRKF